jgi:hypothetical protein
MSDVRPLFAFAFRGGVGQVLRDLAEADLAAGNADFIWVHLDLRDAAAQAWLRRRPWPPDVVEMVVAPIQRGRLFITSDPLYGHLRDFHDEPDAVPIAPRSPHLNGKVERTHHVDREEFWGTVDPRDPEIEMRLSKWQHHWN